MHECMCGMTLLYMYIYLVFPIIILYSNGWYVKLNDITTPKVSTAQFICLILTIMQVHDSVDCHGVHGIAQILDFNL